MISKKVREVIFKRDDETCVSCGTRQNLTIHHRVNRGSGGSKLFDSYPYLLLVCIFCNSNFESDNASAETARKLGYKLARNAKPAIDPTQVAVYYHSKREWFYLDNGGKKHE